MTEKQTINPDNASFETLEFTLRTVKNLTDYITVSFASNHLTEEKYGAIMMELKLFRNALLKIQWGKND